jgi:glucose/mannose transport system substrate-binding protein
VLALSSCDAPNESKNGQLEIVSWWTAPGEVDALEAVVGVFQRQYPNQTVNNSLALGSTDARESLRTRILDGTPPDTFQANGGWDLMTWVRYNPLDDSENKMEAIETLADTQGWRSVIPEPVLETVSYNGSIYAVPLNVHRVNVLFFNKKLFDQNGIAVPTTLDELFAVAARFKELGITPIALGSKGAWTLSLLLFENLINARNSGEVYRAFLTDRKDPFSIEMRTALADLWKLLSFTNSDAPRLSWSDAVDMVLRDEAAMTIMGDWAKGYFLAHDKMPDVDFGQVAMPGTNDRFVFTTYTFGIPKGALNRAAAGDLIGVLGSKVGQEVFSPIKGSIPARGDIDPADATYDAMAKETIRAFRAALPDPNVLVPATAILAHPQYITAVQEALAKFAFDGNPSPVMHTMRNWTDVLCKYPRTPGCGSTVQFVAP